MIGVKDVPPGLFLSADDAYTQMISRKVQSQPGGGEVDETDYNFVFLKNAPFSRGEVVRLRYWVGGIGGGIAVSKFKAYDYIQLTYEGETDLSYDVQYDESSKDPPKLLKK